MAERAHASHIPPGRYSKRLGDGVGRRVLRRGQRLRAGNGGSAASAGSPPTSSFSVRNFLAVFKYSRRALELVWSTNRFLAVVIALLTVVAGALPAGVAYVGSLIVDAVVAAIRVGGVNYARVIELVALEGVLIAGIAAAQRGLSLCQWLLRAQLGQRVNVMILEKALTLDLRHFEDSEFYDKLTRARREASSRPLSLVMRTFGLVQNGISLISFGTLLVHFSPWAVAILLLAGLPAFIAEAKFSGDAFSLFRWRSPDTRMQMYLETVLARDEHAKEVKLYNLGDRFLDRYQSIFNKLYTADRALAIKRDVWGFVLGLVRDRRAVWRVCVDRRERGSRAHHARPDDDVRDAVPAGAVGRHGEPLGGRRHVRGQPLPLDALRLPRDRSRRRRAATRSAGPIPRTACASRTWASRTPARASRRWKA